MSQWYFAKHDGFDDLTGSTAVDSFIDRSIRDMATAIVREGIQNAMDARREDLPPAEPVRVRLTLSRRAHTEGRSLNQTWFGTLFPHLELDDIGAPEAPRADEACDVLIFEDFGTTGLTGDYRAPYTPGQKNNFVNFLYHEGITGKGNRQRGSRGVGKIVFTMASRARTFFAMTVREGEEGEPLLVGKNVLRFRKHGHELFRGPAYFLSDWPASGPREPVREPSVIQRFITDFPVSRNSDSGLSVVIPFLDPSVTGPDLRRAVISEYAYAILSGRLEVTVDDHGQVETFEASHLPPTGDAEVDAELNLARWAAAHRGAPELKTDPPPPDALQRLAPEHVPERVRDAVIDALNRRKRVAVRMPLHIHPKRGGPVETWFDVFLEHTDAFATKPTFIRELLPVTDVREARSAPHVRALVVINEGPLADLLRAAEGANHTDWSPRTDQFKEKYRGRCGEISFVARSVSALMDIIRGDDQKPVGGIATEFFAARLQKQPEKAGRQRLRKGRKPEEPPPPPPPPRPARWRVTQVEGGFVLRRGDPEAPLPPKMTVRVAYDVLRGSPWKQYDPSDFDFANKNSDITISTHHAEVDTTGGKGNRLTVKPADNEFEVRVTGFDVNRDLIVDVKATEETVRDGDASELHEAEEAAV